MRVFAAVAEAASFTAAGRVLDLPKQTVSRRVAALEDALGVRLVHRTSRTMRLTPAGVAFAERCVEVVHLAEEAAAVVSDEEEPRGLLRITATDAIGEAFVVPVVEALLARHPAVSAEVVLTERRVDLVAEGFDVAIRVGRLDDSSLVATRLGPATLRIVVRPPAPAVHTPADLRDVDCIVHAAEARLARWPVSDGRGGVALVPVHARLAVNQVAAILHACRAGAGVALLPEFLVRDDLASGALVSVLDDHLADVGSVWSVTPSRRLQSSRVRAFLELARDPASRLLSPAPPGAAGPSTPSGPRRRVRRGEASRPPVG
jgi:DNA-binding transcriptional LysR family regulator